MQVAMVYRMWNSPRQILCYMFIFLTFLFFSFTAIGLVRWSIFQLSFGTISTVKHMLQRSHHQPERISSLLWRNYKLTKHQAHEIHWVNLTLWLTFNNFHSKYVLIWHIFHLNIFFNYSNANYFLHFGYYSLINNHSITAN